MRMRKPDADPNNRKKRRKNPSIQLYNRSSPSFAALQQSLEVRWPTGHMAYHVVSLSTALCQNRVLPSDRNITVSAHPIPRDFQLRNPSPLPAVLRPNYAALSTLVATLVLQNDLAQLPYRCRYLHEPPPAFCRWH